jgi:hypothetical protein
VREADFHLPFINHGTRQFPVVVDIGPDFCKADVMSSLPGKLVAVFLAIWLPLFSANVLAASIGMQSMAGGCQMAPAGASHNRQISAMHQHMPLAALHGQQHQHDGQYPSHRNCDLCQLACCGYLADATGWLIALQPLIRPFIPASVQFQSVSSAPLDPPPLVRV